MIYVNTVFENGTQKIFPVYASNFNTAVDRIRNTFSYLSVSNIPVSFSKVSSPPDELVLDELEETEIFLDNEKYFRYIKRIVDLKSKKYSLRYIAKALNLNIRTVSKYYKYYLQSID